MGLLPFRLSIPILLRMVCLPPLHRKGVGFQGSSMSFQESFGGRGQFFLPPFLCCSLRGALEAWLLSIESFLTTWSLSRVSENAKRRSPERGFQIHPLGSGTRIWVSTCLLSWPFCSFPMILLSCSFVFVAFLRISCDLPRSPMRAVSLGPWVLGRVGEVS